MSKRLKIDYSNKSLYKKLSSDCELFLMINQISLFIKSLPRMLERGKELLYSSSDSNSFITSEQSSNIISAVNAEISSIGSSIISYSLSSAGSLIETAVYFLIVPIIIFFLLYD